MREWETTCVSMDYIASRLCGEVVLLVYSQAIVTPGSLKRQRRCRSATSTPSRPQDGGRESSSDAQQKLFFPPLSEIQNIPSSSPTNLLSLTPSSFEEKEEDEEVSARECLTEELKILQESKASLNQQLEVLCTIILPL